MSKTIAQISFNNDANLDLVEEQLKDLATRKEYQYVCCFIPPKHVKHLGLPTNIVDMLTKIIPDIKFILEDHIEITNGDKAMSKEEKEKYFKHLAEVLEEMRPLLALDCEKLFVLGSGINTGVADEILEHSGAGSTIVTL